MCASRLSLHPEPKLLLRYDKPAADPQRWETVLMQKFIVARRRNAQRTGDKLRVEKQRLLVKIFDARCVQSLFYLQLILEISEKKLAFRSSLCQSASGSRRRVQRRGIFVLGKTFSRRNTFVFQGKMTRHSAERPAVWRVGGFQIHPELKNTVAVRVFRNAARRPTVAAAELSYKYKFTISPYLR